jgi:hypothetical protein
MIFEVLKLGITRFIVGILEFGNILVASLKGSKTTFKL